MSKMTLEQVRDWHRDMENENKKTPWTNSVSEAHKAAADAIDAHLAAQAEWPSEGDIKKVGYALIDAGWKPPMGMGEISMRAALQSTRPPVGVVSDEDVEMACNAANATGGVAYDGRLRKCAARAALESYASRHAPTKD